MFHWVSVKNLKVKREEREESGLAQSNMMGVLDLSCIWLGKTLSGKHICVTSCNP